MLVFGGIVVGGWSATHDVVDSRPTRLPNCITRGLSADGSRDTARDAAYKARDNSARSCFREKPAQKSSARFRTLQTKVETRGESGHSLRRTGSVTSLSQVGGSGRAGKRIVSKARDA